jgi:hypothetical protein
VGSGSGAGLSLGVVLRSPTDALEPRLARRSLNDSDSVTAPADGSRALAETDATALMVAVLA